MVTLPSLVFIPDLKLLSPIFKNQLLVPTLFCLVWNFLKDISEIASAKYCDTPNNMFKNIILAILHYFAWFFNVLIEVELLQRNACWIFILHYTYYKVKEKLSKK
jgi:hypothetical protein